LNLRVRQFSVTVRTTWSGVSSGISTAMSSVAPASGAVRFLVRLASNQGPADQVGGLHAGQRFHAGVFEQHVDAGRSAAWASENR
jgi:hypothetical protein